MDSKKQNSSLNLANLSLVFSSEDRAREFMEAKRWPNGPVCPHCKSEKAYTLTGKKESASPVRKGVYKCSSCRKQFSVRVGTIFEDSKIELRKWLIAIHLMTSSKKGISSLRIQRELGVTYKTAWFITHRIREAMKQDPIKGMLGGGGNTVECDETFVGGKARNAHGDKVPEKKAVAVLVERDGRVRAKHVENVSATELRQHIIDNVHIDSKIVSDDFTSYKRIGKPFSKGHDTVQHTNGEYVNKDGEHTNTAESFNALLKRGHYGIYHQMSKKHLHRYCDEFVFRWDHRKVDDGERMLSLIQATDGKRLMYKQPVL